MLRSTGSFEGQLDRIAVRGKTEVPDFSLDTANHPMPLSTEFQAVVDGTSGDTYLEHIQAKLGSSEFSCQGAVVDVKGQGHKIDVKTDVPNGQIADFLGLAVKTSPAPMTGLLTLQAKLQIAPGKESVSQKMTMQGAFTLRQIHFTNPAIEDKVDLMSLRAQGKTDDLKPGAPDVTSKMTGHFAMRDGELVFSRLDYALPGGNVHLTGRYTMDGRKYKFAGKVRTRAEVSQMVASKWKSLLLKPLDPFFSKHGWGTEIPIKVILGHERKTEVRVLALRKFLLLYDMILEGAPQFWMRAWSSSNADPSTALLSRGRCGDTVPDPDCSLTVANSFSESKNKDVEEISLRNSATAFVVFCAWMSLPTAAAAQSDPLASLQGKQELRSSFERDDHVVPESPGRVPQDQCRRQA